MKESAVQTVIAEARNCAIAMLESVIFIQNELANVRMTDALRIRTEQLCSVLIGTKHDIISELDDLDRLFDSEGPASVDSSQFDHIIRWFRDDLDSIHQLVTALHAVAEKTPECGSAYVLIAESATNILTAFNRLRAAAESLRETIDRRIR